ncbi:MAG: response regulator transcription factor [Chitinispirillaceae bacterium]|nr:response regulator transcription factor [Chitinispirillaceae bacterium]
MNYRAIIADDEKTACTRLSRLLKKCAPEITVIAEAHDGKAACESIEQQKPELAFLDIQMPALNGIEVALATSHKPFVIFVTAYNQYALDAFKASAVDYLLKPVEEEPLFTAVDKFKRLIRPAQGCEEILSRLAERLEGAGRQRLALSIGDSIKLVPYDEIVCLEADNKYITVYTKTGEYVTEKSLAELENILPAGRFIRIHRKHIINTAFIDVITKWFDRRLKVKLNIPFKKELVVGRGYIDNVRNM